MFKQTTLTAMFFALAILSACSAGSETAIQLPATATTVPLPQRGLANVEVVEIHQIESSPVRVSVFARGHLPDECATIDQIHQNRTGSHFMIMIDSIFYDDPSCSTGPIPFEETVVLDVLGLPAGIYVVDVNGLQGTFTLKNDNIPDQENGVIGGQVWVDECVSVSGQQEELSPPPGCIVDEDGTIYADGLVDTSEVGLGGVLVNLGSGSCPSTGLAATITDESGMYLFSGLKGGTYCISIDDQASQNADILSSGSWTYPNREGLAATTTFIMPGESNLDIYFGWQPEPTEILQTTPLSPDDCTNKAIFREDVSIPDDTIITAGETFTKTWKLQNIGSCTWNEEYSLVNVAGAPLGAQEIITLTISVSPGEEADLSVALQAPMEAGDYRSEWKIAASDGFLFGIGPGSDRAFWVQISVVDE